MTSIGKKNNMVSSLHFIAGLAAAALGVAALGSLLHPSALMVAKHALTVRQISALCFLISGLGLISLANAGAQTIIRACSATIIGVSGVNTFLFFIRFVFGGHAPVLGFVKDLDRYLSGASMPPNTATCFLLFGIALWRMTTPQSSRTLRGLAFLASLIMATALVFLLGHVGGLDSAYAWFRIIPMNLYSSVGFVALAVGIFTFVRGEEMRQGVQGLGVFPVPALFGVVTLVAFLWLASAARERQRTEEITDFHLEGLQKQFQTSVYEHIRGIVGVAQRQETAPTGGSPPPGEFEIVQAYYPAFRAIGWVHGNAPISWVVWEAGLHLPTDIAVDTQISRALSSVRSKGTIVVTPTLGGQHGGYLIIAAPSSRVRGVASMVVGVLDVARVFNPIVRGYLRGDYSVLVSADQIPIYGSPGARESSLRFARISAFELSGLEWTIILEPKAGFLKKENSPLPGVILLTGLLIVILLAAVFRLSRAAYLRASQAEGAYEQLKSESADRQAAERSLEETQAQLRQSQKMEAIGRLAGGIAHDFNSFLTAITGFSEIALTKLQGNPQVSVYLQEIRKAGEEAGSVIQQLLAFSRKQVLEMRVVNLNSSIKNMETLLRHLLGDGIELELELSHEVGRVRADPAQIEQVIMNLAVNARDAIGIYGTIRITTANTEVGDNCSIDQNAQEQIRPGPYVRIIVADTGRGMTAAVKAHVFEPFFTTKEVGKGTGLGLAVVYGIVRQSDGYVFVDSEPGRGTSFSIYVPMLPRGVVETPPVPKAEWNSADFTNRVVLVVEDNEGVRKLTCEALQIHGFTIMEAAGGEEALALLEKRGSPVDLLLTDIVMPQLSGDKLAEIVSKIYPETKVLFMSGYLGDMPIRKDIPLLQKPFTPQALVEMVAKVLGVSEKKAA